MTATHRFGACGLALLLLVVLGGCGRFYPVPLSVNRYVPRLSGDLGRYEGVQVGIGAVSVTSAVGTDALDYWSRDEWFHFTAATAPEAFLRMALAKALTQVGMQVLRASDLSRESVIPLLDLRVASWDDVQIRFDVTVTRAGQALANRSFVAEVQPLREVWEAQTHEEAAYDLLDALASAVLEDARIARALVGELPPDQAERAAEWAQLPLRPEATELQALFNRARDTVHQCVGARVLLHVSVMISGESGRVARVDVGESDLPTAAIDCVAGAVTALVFPRFQQRSLTVEYVFRFLAE